MYVCMYVCNVGMYVCMDGWICVCIHARMHGWMYVCMQCNVMQCNVMHVQ